MHLDHQRRCGLWKAEAGPGGHDEHEHARDHPEQQHQGGHQRSDEVLAEEAQRGCGAEWAAGAV